jgi:ComF family protein
VQLYYIYLQHNKHNMQAFEHIINAIAPHRCLTCGREGTLLCDPCSTSVKSPPPCCFKCGIFAQGYLCEGCRPAAHIEKVYIAAPYQAAAKQLIHKLKFERAPAAAALIARQLAGILSERVTTEENPVLLTHVPTAARRVRQRGYDQAALIARELSRRTGLPYRPCLIRVGIARQLGQDRIHRQQQLQGAFRVTASLPVPATTVVLIDDVLTTGASVEAAAAALHQAGILHVEAAVYAVA